MSSSVIDSILIGLLVILKHSGLQFLATFGFLFVSGFILSFISKWISNLFQQFHFPKLGLYLFGIVGIPLHELCHALFAKLFTHDVRKIKWFDPKGKGGAYGQVTHYYQDNNLLHRIGLFFIGMGPVLLAPFILLIGYYLLVPSANSFSLQAMKPGPLLEGFLQSMLAVQNWTSIGFYVFLYLALCLTSQMELSPDDYKVARGGGLPILFLLMSVNLVAYIFKFDLHERLAQGFKMVAVLWAACLLLAILISILNLIICFFVLNIFNRLFGSGGINPFRSSQF